MKRLKRKRTKAGNAVHRTVIEQCQLCTLCDRPPVRYGFYALADGKGVAYGLCDEHSGDPRSPSRVAAAIDRWITNSCTLRGAEVDPDGKVKHGLFFKIPKSGMN